MVMKMQKSLSSSVLLFSVVAPGLAMAGVPLDSDAVADMAERVTPAVVNIATERKAELARHPLEGHPFFPELFGQGGPGGPGGRQRREMGAGSGVVISADGFIVTNNHVIDGADRIKVIFSNKTELDAELVGTDKPSDLALIKVKAKALPHLSFGDSAKLRLGEFVLAIGNPFGVGQTLTMGIVSAKGRANIGIVEYEDFIQTDAAINPGNSGGALVNMRGELVGINTAILSKSGGAHGIGFAVPSNMVKPILDQVQKHGRVRRGWLGVGIQDLTSDLASSLEISGTEGVLVTDVMEGGPAAKGKLQAGDVITSLNGRKMSSTAHLRNEIALMGPGTKAQLGVFRDGKRLTLQISLDEKEEKREVAARDSSDSSLFAGIRLENLNPDLRRKLEAPIDLEGALVAELDPNSRAAAAGLRPGDVITRIDKQRIKSLSDIDASALKDKKRLLLRVWRRGSFVFLVLRD